MKNLIRILLFSGLSVVGLNACHKDFSGTSSGGSTNSASHALTLSVDTVALGQPLVATIPAGLTVNSANWTVSPSKGVQITSSGQSATITFSDSGTYLVTAHYVIDSTTGTHDSCTSTVTVADSAYPPPTDTLTLAGEKLVIIPTSVDTGITFLIETVDSYPCKYSLYYTQNPYPGADSIYVDFLSAGGASGCSGTNGPIVSSFTIRQLAAGQTATVAVFLPPGEGEFNFNVTNDTTSYIFSPSPGSSPLVTMSPLFLAN